jgi:formate dehydrogenase major subunit
MHLREVALAAELIEFRLNGEAASARPDETIIEAAAAWDQIPHLCYKPGMRPDGNCRACMVEIKGERVLAPSCCRKPTAGMEVSSDSPRAVHSQKIIVEMLAADVPARVYKLDSELEQWKRWLGIGAPRFAARAQPKADLSHPAIAVNLDAASSARAACAPAVKSRSTTSSAMRFAARTRQSCSILATRWGASTCVPAANACRPVPPGRWPANDAYLVVADKVVPSVCPYCGVLPARLSRRGQRDRQGRRPRRPGQPRAFVRQGRYGYDYVHHRQRLTRPLIRKQGIAKTADFVMDPADPLAVFREASWEEALQVAGGALKRIRDEHGGKALAGFGSAKGSNEEAYLFQKLVRTGFGSNDVDHCTRLCHVSVAALLEGIGSGAVSNR